MLFQNLTQQTSLDQNRDRTDTVTDVEVMITTGVALDARQEECNARPVMDTITPVPCADQKAQRKIPNPLDRNKNQGETKEEKA